MRVLEDTARFVWSDGKRFERFRKERPLLDRATRVLYPGLVRSRDSAEDEGRGIREGGRRNLSGIVAANFRRCEESLRALEEYGKIFPGKAAGRFKAIRFRIYDLEKEIVQEMKF